MNILLIEDDQNKTRQIIDLLNRNLNELHITEKHSYQSGLNEIINGKYDFIILDMSMPTYDKSPFEDGGRPRAFAGKEILRQMERKNINTPVIIVTQFDTFGEGGNTISLFELNKELSAKFTKTYKGTVYYNAAFKNWENELLNFIYNQ